jgi:WD40 repeat protein
MPYDEQDLRADLASLREVLPSPEARSSCVGWLIPSGCAACSGKRTRAARARAELLPLAAAFLTPVTGPQFHPVMPGDNVTIFHLSDLQFGKNHRFASVDFSGLANPYDTLLARLWDDLQALRQDHGLQPDLAIVTGDLVEWGMPDEFRDARQFLEKLTDSGQKLRQFTGHQGSVLSVAFSPDGRALASGSADGSLRLGDIQTGRCLAVLRGFPEGWVAFTPDGRYEFGGNVAGGFWHATALCRFEVGELDEFIPGLRMKETDPFW